MTTAFTVSVTIDRPTAEVWTRLTDWPAAPAWMSGVDSIRTRVTLTADCRAGGAWRPFGGLLRAAIRRADSGQVSALKRTIETG